LRNSLLFVLLLYVLPGQLTGAVRPLAAQEPARANEVAAALARVPPGTAVRVQTRTGDVIGGFMVLAGDSVLLESGRDRGVGRRSVALANVRSVWYQQRTTRTGATAGAIIGGLGGGAFMGLLALVAAADGSETAKILAVGVLGGAAAGGLIGGVVGAAVPRWTLAYPVGAADRGRAPEVTVSADERAGRRRLGSFEASLGYGRVGGDEPSSGGPGARAALHAELGADPARAHGTTAYFAIGPEVSWFDLGSTDRVRRVVFPSEDEIEFTRAYRALAAGGVVRGGVATGIVRTYGVLGLAYNRWEIEQRDEQWVTPGPALPAAPVSDSRFEHLGYTIGAGTQISLRPLTAIGLELRRTSVGTFDMDLPGSYWSVTLAGSRRW
jgi:hypothetical protein